MMVLPPGFAGVRPLGWSRWLRGDGAIDDGAAAGVGGVQAISLIPLIAGVHLGLVADDVVEADVAGILVNGAGALYIDNVKQRVDGSGLPDGERLEQRPYAGIDTRRRGLLPRSRGAIGKR